MTGEPISAAILTLVETVKPSQGQRDLTVAEAAELLTCSRRTVYELVYRDEINHHRVGNAIRFTRADIDAYRDRESGGLDPVLAKIIKGTQ